MKKPKYTEPMLAWGDEDEMDVDSSRVTKYELTKAGPSKLLQQLARDTAVCICRINIVPRVLPVLHIIRINIVLIFIAYYVFSHPAVS